mmetsp:Transcript_80216/g.235964  ORF Transcript_80216/g.235964 Transcript_80216/m.235964 type:complete len:311 (+) Transcript_80216:103-1035(+)
MGQLCAPCFGGLMNQGKVPNRGHYGEVRYTHMQPPPEGSLHFLGSIRMEVPDEEKAKLFYSDLLGCTKVQSGELRMCAGASRIILPMGQSAYKWPGEIRFWVEDLRETNDMLHMMGPTLGTELLQDFAEGVDWGNYEMLIHCPFNVNHIRVAESPPDRALALRRLFAPPAEGERRTNVLALMDAVHKVPMGSGMVDTVAQFYSHGLQGSVTKISSTFCIAHFSPSKDLHQTLKFMEDTGGLSGAGAVCIYLGSEESFKAAFERCEAVGSPSWGVVSAHYEFRVKTHDGKPLPLEHIVRWTGHPDCTLQSQ